MAFHAAGVGLGLAAELTGDNFSLVSATEGRMRPSFSCWGPHLLSLIHAFLLSPSEEPSPVGFFDFLCWTLGMSVPAPSPRWLYGQWCGGDTRQESERARLLREAGTEAERSGRGHRLLQPTLVCTVTQCPRSLLTRQS